MKRIVLTFGLIAGAIVSGFMATSMIIMHNNPEWKAGNLSMIIGYLTMIMSFALIYVAVKTYRDKHLGGSISFGKAFKLGLGVALIASTMYVIMWALLYNFVMPDFMERYTQQMLESAKADSTPAQLQAKAAEMEQYKAWYKNPVFFVLLTYMEILPVGLVVSLITALILKRKRAADVVMA